MSHRLHGQRGQQKAMQTGRVLEEPAWDSPSSPRDEHGLDRSLGNPERWLVER